MELEKRFIRDAIILNPSQVKVLSKFLELTENKLAEDIGFFPEFRQDLNRDLDTVKVIKNKVAAVGTGIPTTITQFEGLILVCLLMSFRLNHYDVDSLTHEVENLGRLFDDLFHERGYLPFFYIVKEDRLAD